LFNLHQPDRLDLLVLQPLSFRERIHSAGLTPSPVQLAANGRASR